MKKHLSLILSAIMVLSLFAAVAIAAVNVEVCPTCNQGEMRDSTGHSFSSYEVACPKNPLMRDTITRTYICYYSGCNNQACSECVLESKELISETSSCGHSIP